MIKLVLQLLVAFGVWFGLGALGWHWGWRVGAVFVGFLVVHALWERFVVDPFLYLGAVSVDPGDPVMREATAAARDTFPKFLEIYPDHVADSMVRFEFETDTGHVERLWGDLRRIDEREAVVYLRTPPHSHEGELEPEMTIARDAIDDWQVEFRDGTLRGGYTNRALFKIYEREIGPIHPKLLPQFARFKDVDW